MSLKLVSCTRENEQFQDVDAVSCRFVNCVFYGHCKFVSCRLVDCNTDEAEISMVSTKECSSGSAGKMKSSKKLSKKRAWPYEKRQKVVVHDGIGEQISDGVIHNVFGDGGIFTTSIGRPVNAVGGEMFNFLNHHQPRTANRIYGNLPSNNDITFDADHIDYITSNEVKGNKVTVRNVEVNIRGRTDGGCKIEPSLLRSVYAKELRIGSTLFSRYPPGMIFLNENGQMNALGVSAKLLVNNRALNDVQCETEPPAPRNEPYDENRVYEGEQLQLPDDQQDRTGVCVACLDHRVNRILQPCKHACLCAECYCGLQERVCPTCRKPIQYAERMYLS